MQLQAANRMLMRSNSLALPWSILYTMSVHRSIKPTYLALAHDCGCCLSSCKPRFCQFHAMSTRQCEASSFALLVAVGSLLHSPKAAAACLLGICAAMVNAFTAALHDLQHIMSTCHVGHGCAEPFSGQQMPAVRLPFAADNITVPCVNGVQQWQGLYYPGIITPHPTGTEDYSIRGKFRVPLNFHIGNMILAAATNYTVDSVPPSKFGGDFCRASALHKVL